MLLEQEKSWRSRETSKSGVLGKHKRGKGEEGNEHRGVERILVGHFKMLNIDSEWEETHSFKMVVVAETNGAGFSSF